MTPPAAGRAPKRHRAENLAGLVAELQTELNRADRAAAAGLGVGGAEDLQVLRLLLAQGGLRVGDLARLQGASNATASARIDRLEKRGFVRRERIGTDRRTVTVQLTPAGKKAAGSSRRGRLNALDPVVDEVPAGGLVQLIDALRSARDHEV